ncbi:MAG: GNAT family N-acetyltransferase [Paracoccaceae bacterium]
MTDMPSYHRLCPETAHLLHGADVFDYPVDPEQLGRFVKDQGHHLVFARVGAQVIGFASGTVLLHPDKPPAFFINEVDVVPDFQRQGVATALCRKLIAMVRAQGCVGIWLATEADNHAARALYRGLAGRETDAVVVYDWDADI